MNNILYAKEGFVFRRISDGMIYGSEVALGYTYFLNGELLDKPHLDNAEDFEEIKVEDIEI